MPLIIEDIVALKEREGWSYFTFAVELNKCGKEYNLEGRFTYTPQTILDWTKPENNPSTKILDPLYLLARKYGHDDLMFYKKPST